MLNNPITIGLSPNIQKDDLIKTLSVLAAPGMWKKGAEVKKVEVWFQSYFSHSFARTYNSGRSALSEVLKAFDIKEGSEVIIQAFTCVAVPDAVLRAGAKPVYTDVNETLNMDDLLLEKYINRRTKAIIVQHTFGIPANLEKITKIAQKYNTLLIEDCAHCLGIEYHGKKLGQWGDAAVFSFGRDKVISSVFGGAAIISQKHSRAIAKLNKSYQSLSTPGYFWILQQLIHPLLTSLLLPIYKYSLGKLFLVIFQTLRLLSKPNPKTITPARYPNALAVILLGQLGKLKEYSGKRREVTDRYFKELKTEKKYILPVKSDDRAYLRFNILTTDAPSLRKYAKKRGIYLGNWYHNIIDPAGIDYERIHFVPGNYPKSQIYAQKSVNLPTYPRMGDKDVEKVISFLNTYADQRDNK